MWLIKCKSCNAHWKENIESLNMAYKKNWNLRNWLKSENKDIGI
jgi:hypothetical protein